MPLHNQSVVKFLNKIPKTGWDTIPAKRFCYEVDVRSVTGEEELLGLSKSSGVMRKSDMEQRASEAENYAGYKKVSIGDLVSNKMQAWNGMFGISRYDGITSPDYAVYRLCNSVERRFVEYVCRTELYSAEFHSKSRGMGTGFLRLNQSEFLSTPFHLPDLPTQRAIADFLDRETARIDTLIEKKQRLVELLGEKRQSDIAYALTGGSLKGVALKPTDVSWISALPSHWELKKIKHVGKAIIGLTYAPENLVSEGEGTPVLRANNIQAGKLTPENLVYVDAPIPKKLRLQIGDILICSRNGSRNLIGKNAIVTHTFEGMTFGAFNTVLRSKYHNFLYWVLQSPIFERQAGSFLTSTINQLTISTLSNLTIPFAPPHEQKQIADFLSAREVMFETLLLRLLRSIDRLKEYRSALITSAVTGQIDVTKWTNAETTDHQLDAVEEEFGA